MKSKITAKLLLPVVLAIWGLIGWKIYAAMQGSDEPLAVHSEPKPFSQKEENLPDSITLLVNYRDPFLGKTADKKTSSHSTTQQNHPVKLEHIKKDLPKPAAEAVRLYYYGLVKRNGDNKSVGFLSINGESHFVQSGQTIDELKILRLWKDSVELLRGKEKLMVRK